MKLEECTKTLSLSDLKNEARNTYNLINMKRCYHVGDRKLLEALMKELLDRGMTPPEIMDIVSCVD